MDYLTIAAGGTGLILAAGGIITGYYQLQNRKMLKSIMEAVQNYEVSKHQLPIKENKLEKEAKD